MSVGVLVRVEVRGLDTGGTDFQDLSSQFPLDFRGANYSCGESRYEAAE
jgi:hypothetical protein